MSTETALPFTVFAVFCDPGHAWLKVRRDLVRSLGVEPSRFSYQRGDWLYLEEDCDAGAFLRAFEERYGETRLVYKYVNRESRVRSYQHFDGFRQEILVPSGLAD